ncbi:MAG TPA: hypothetical protein VF290_17435 [Pyrinomonadaceae bacterium]
MTKTFCLLTILVLAAFGAGCTAADSTATQNPAQATTSPGPDNSEISTTVDKDGTRTETRTFRDNPHVSKVVVTTRKDGTRTVKATSRSGEEKVVDTTEDVLQATGEKVADAAGFVAAQGEKVGNEVADKAEDVADKTVSTSKDVGEKTVEGAKTVGEKTADGAKKVGSKTVEGAKKAGSAVKKVIP